MAPPPRSRARQQPPKGDCTIVDTSLRHPALACVLAALIGCLLGLATGPASCPPSPLPATVPSDSPRAPPYIYGVHPETGLPLVPTSLLPFLDRVAYAMPDQILHWVNLLPSHVPFSVDAETEELRRALLGYDWVSHRGKLEEWVDDYESRILTANEGLRAVWAEALDRLGWSVVCEGDEEARRVWDKLMRRLADGQDVPAGDMEWDRRRCLWTRVKTSLGMVKEGEVDFAKVMWDFSWPVRDACDGTSEWETVYNDAREVAATARTEQHRLLDQVASVAQSEAQYIYRHVPRSSRRLSPTPGYMIPLTYASDFGTGQTLQKRTPGTIFGVEIPRPDAQEKLEALMTEFVAALITEMLGSAAADAILAVQQETCHPTHDTRSGHLTQPSHFSPLSLPTYDTPSGHFTQPSHFSPLGLLQQGIHFLSSLASPFAPPDSTGSPPQRRLEWWAGVNDEDYILQRRQKSSPHLGLWERAVRNSTCVFLARRLTAEGAGPDAEKAVADAEEAVWKFWSEGTEVGWYLRGLVAGGNNQFWSSGDIGVDLDVGATPGLVERRMCTARLRELGLAGD